MAMSERNVAKWNYSMDSLWSILKWLKLCQTCEALWGNMKPPACEHLNEVQNLKEKILWNLQQPVTKLKDPLSRCSYDCSLTMQVLRPGGKLFVHIFVPGRNKLGEQQIYRYVMICVHVASFCELLTPNGLMRRFRNDATVHRQSFWYCYWKQQSTCIQELFIVTRF